MSLFKLPVETYIILGIVRRKELIIEMVFAKRLKYQREQLKKSNKKWTQKYVADKINVARVTYTAYENGTKAPPMETINKIADLFNVSTDYLLGRSEHPYLTEIEDKQTEEEATELEEIIESFPEEIKKQETDKIIAFAKWLLENSANADK